MLKHHSTQPGNAVLRSLFGHMQYVLVCIFPPCVEVLKVLIVKVKEINTKIGGGPILRAFTLRSRRFLEEEINQASTVQNK